MPLTATVLMGEAVGGESVTANLKVNDGTSDVIDLDFTVGFRSTHDGLAKDVQVELTKLMQVEIDRYKAGVTLKLDSEFTAMANNIQSGLAV